MEGDLTRRPYNIEIGDTEETETGWRFTVYVREKDRKDEFTVSLASGYWEKLTEGEEEPAEIVQRAITFLLEREPKEALPAVIDIKDIGKKFSEFETEMNEL